MRWTQINSGSSHSGGHTRCSVLWTRFSHRLPLLEHHLLLLCVPPAAPPLTHQQVSEGGPEGLVAEGIADGVDGAVDVAEPVPQRPQRGWDAVLTEGVDQHHDVVGQPGGDEGQEDGAQRSSGLTIVGLLLVPALVDFCPGPAGKAFGQSCIFQGDGGW